MTMFIEVTDSQSGAKASVNPKHICVILDIGNKTVISTSDGRDLFTKENYAEVLKKIDGAKG